RGTPPGWPTAWCARPCSPARTSTWSSRRGSTNRDARGAPRPVSHDERMKEVAPFASPTLRLRPGDVDLSTYDTRATAGFNGDKEAGKQALKDLGDELADLQERLWARRTVHDPRRVLLVLQGMDTSGKGGVIRKALRAIDPQALEITAFKAPTDEELEQDFLWRIRRAVPAPGHVGVWDRSHYEDVLAQRVRGLAEPDEIERRYGAIVDFEQELVDDHVTVVKCF